VDHQHRLALALDLDGHAVDEHSSLPDCRGAAQSFETEVSKRCVILPPK
jgi:hypothetical protein